ncbi:MAG: hypothetical protein EAZ62_03010 [Sphingobacteriia bacterium]|nr:MAG: hypothetical protein EAZ62_03010 [Sphingobacteriia bacterium]
MKHYLTHGLKMFLIIFGTSFIFTTTVNAQTQLEADSMYVKDGLAFGYSIVNVQTKEDYERYEVQFFVRNLACTKFMLLRTQGMFDRDPSILAEFRCLNATGKRFTNKGKTLNMPSWNYTLTDAISKELSGKSIQLGFIIRKDQTISGSEILLTPKGEKPSIKVFPVVLSEI